MTDGHPGEFHPADHAHEHEARPVPAGPHPHDSEEFDSEINIRAILWTAAGVVAICILSVIAMWGMFVGFDAFDRRNASAQQAAPGVMPESMRQSMRQPAPPGPLLQAAPTEDMTAMRAENDRVLQHAGWVDRAQGTVRVPIDVAIDVLAARGLPKVTTPPLAEMAAHGSTADEGRPPTDQPSPGTLLPPPGMGMGNLGPPSAGAGQQSSPAMPEPAEAERPAGARKQAAPSRQPVPRTPALPPPPPPGGMP
ncbi:MAG TPA: hypothetical protein VN999_01915 [Thermoanaerobaculia bacterium]|nr:hypothetical protein [Thermoanaerobaculia bacterium]